MSEDDGEELYDEGSTAPVQVASSEAKTSDSSHNDDGEVYDEGFTQEGQDGLDPYQDDDELYETYDDVAGPDMISPSSSVSSPPPELPDRNNLTAILRKKDTSPKHPPSLPPRNDPTSSKPVNQEEAAPSTGVRNFYESLYYGVWDCRGDTEDELSFTRGDVIQILSKTHCGEEWWVGKLDDKVGIVPKNFLSAAYELVK